MSLSKQDKEDLRVMMKGVVHEVIAEEVTPRFAKLESKIDANHSVAVRHLLEVKGQVGSLHKDLTTFNEAIAAAAR
jgi:hypothetical protein